jgi:hypothetical protein
MRYLLLALLTISSLLGGCTRTRPEPSPPPIVRPNPPTPGPVVTPTNPHSPVPEEKFTGLVGLTTDQVILQVGRPWRIVQGDPEYWHYKTKRSEDGSTTDTEVVIRNRRVLDINVDF